MSMLGDFPTLRDNGLKYMADLQKEIFWSPDALAGAGLR